jgi:hypothetical protein
MSIAHVSSPQFIVDSVQNEPGPSTFADVPSAVISMGDQHSVLEGLEQEMGFMNRESNPQLASNYNSVASGVTFRPSKMSIDQSQTINQPQIITHAVNQSWMAYDPNPVSVSGPVRGRRCAVCKEAGRNGSDCPGKTNRTKCKYNCKCCIYLYYNNISNQ